MALVVAIPFTETKWAAHRRNLGWAWMIARASCVSRWMLVFRNSKVGGALGLQDPGKLPAPVSRVATVAFLASDEGQRRDAPGDRPEGQDLWGRGLPWPKGHALHELQDGHRVGGISLGPVHPGAHEVLSDPWVHHHDLDARGSVQGQGQVEAVDAGGFQADAGRTAPPGEQAAQLAMPGRRVVHAGLLAGLPRNLVRDGERIGADIDPDLHLLAHRVLPWYGALRSPDPEPSPTDLVDAGSRASDTPRLW